MMRVVTEGVGWVCMHALVNLSEDGLLRETGTLGGEWGNKGGWVLVLCGVSMRVREVCDELFSCMVR